jgi:hypothetical protein
MHGERALVLAAFRTRVLAAPSDSWSAAGFIDGLNDPVFGHGATSGTLILQ